MTVRAGLSIISRVFPLCPFWPPLFFPVFFLMFLMGTSDLLGGIWLLWLSLCICASRSRIRSSNRAMIFLWAMMSAISSSSVRSVKPEGPFNMSTM